MKNIVSELLLKLGSLGDGPYLIRAHYLLCSGDGAGRPKWGSSNVYTEDERGDPVYDWEIVDRVLDAGFIAGHSALRRYVLGAESNRRAASPAPVATRNGSRTD